MLPYEQFLLLISKCPDSQTLRSYFTEDFVKHNELCFTERSKLKLIKLSPYLYSRLKDIKQDPLKDITRLYLEGTNTTDNCLRFLGSSTPRSKRRKVEAVVEYGGVNNPIP